MAKQQPGPDEFLPGKQYRNAPVEGLLKLKPGDLTAFSGILPVIAFHNSTDPDERRYVIFTEEGPELVEPENPKIPNHVTQQKLLKTAQYPLF